jgi:23S rRNA G2445 N2-methylase RlmL
MHCIEEPERLRRGRERERERERQTDDYQDVLGRVGGVYYISGTKADAVDVYYTNLKARKHKRVLRRIPIS